MKTISSLTVGFVLALISSSAASSPDTLSMTYGTKIPVCILDTSGKEFIVVSIDRKEVRSYTTKGSFRSVSDNDSGEAFASDYDLPFREISENSAWSLRREEKSFSIMAVVGGAMTATGGILFWRAMTVDDLGDAALLGITSFPLSISGITILAIGTAESIKYRMWLSRLNLSAQIGRNNDAIKLTYNF